MNDLRLDGLNTTALDRYLIALGFLSLLQRTGLVVRSSWAPDDVLVLHTTASLDELVTVAVNLARDAPERAFALVATPWRGKAADERSFAQLRNDAHDAALAWYDAVYVPTRVKDEWQTSGNPLLGQGGAFGRSDIADGVAAARQRLSTTLSGSRAAGVAEGLAGLVTGTSVSSRVAKALGVTNKVLGAYSSGRGTAPGGSTRDVEATAQNVRANAWEILLVVEGLLWFRGTRVRAPVAGLPTQGGFPMLVRSSAAGLDAATREQDDHAARDEVLAPLWSAPSRTPVVQRAVRAGRLRLATGRGRISAANAIEAAVAVAGQRAAGLGLDRYVRFAFVVPSDPRSRFAVRRGPVGPGTLSVADAVATTIVPYLRAQARLEPLPEHRSAPHRRALRNLEEATATVVREPAGSNQRRLVAALLAHEQIAARVHPAGLHAPRLPLWWGGGRDDNAEDATWLVARAIARANPGLATELLSTERVESRLLIGVGASPPDLTRASRPVDIVVRCAAGVARRASAREESARHAATLPPDRLAYARNAILGPRPVTPEEVARLVPVALRVEVSAGPRSPQASGERGSAGAVGSTLLRLLDGAELATERADLAEAALTGDQEHAVRIAARTAYRRRATGESAVEPLTPPASRVLASHDPQALALAVLLGASAPPTSEHPPEPNAREDHPDD